MNLEPTSGPADTQAAGGIGASPSKRPLRDASPADVSCLRAAIRESKFTPEQSAVAWLLTEPSYDEDTAKRIEGTAAQLIADTRTDRTHRMVLDRFLAEYGLSNREGIALM